MRHGRGGGTGSGKTRQCIQPWAGLVLLFRFNKDHSFPGFSCSYVGIMPTLLSMKKSLQPFLPVLWLSRLSEMKKGKRPPTGKSGDSPARPARASSALLLEYSTQVQASAHAFNPRRRRTTECSCGAHLGAAVPMLTAARPDLMESLGLFPGQHVCLSGKEVGSSHTIQLRPVVRKRVRASVAGRPGAWPRGGSAHAPGALHQCRCW